MNSIKYKFQTTFLRNVICALALATASPMLAQEEGAATSRQKKVAAEKYNLMTIKGKVLDDVTKAPLSGVQVKTLANSRYTAMTDENGVFEIKVPDFTTALFVHTPEYLSQQVAVSGASDNVVVYMLSDKYRQIYNDGTNYSAQRTFKANQVQNYSIDTEIQSQLGADVRSIQRSAAPGVGNNMFVRGINSINASAQPLIIVDGVEMDMQHNRGSFHDGQVINMLGNVMAADIENVTILKNATALYGARGANGVILIETKRGHSMATRIDANLSVGLSLVPKLPTMMDASQYRTYATEMLGTYPGLKDKDMPNFNFLNDDPNGFYYHTYHNNTDWTDEVYETALTQNYSINVQGGDDIGMYNLSIGYVDGESTAKLNDYSRMNVRFNTDINIFRNFSTKFNLNIARTTANVFDDGIQENMSTGTITSPTFLSLIKAPILSPYQYNKYVGGFTGMLSEYDDIYAPLGESYSLANPVAILSAASGNNKNYAENTYFQAMISPTYRINNDWSVNTTFSYSLNRQSQRYTRPSQGVPGFEIHEMGTVYNKYASLFSNENNIMSNTVVNYSHIFGPHSLSGFAGFRYNYFSYSSDILSTQYTSRQDDKNPQISGSAANFTNGGGANDVWKQIQWYGNIDYNYKNRYFLTLSLLGEANSRFGKEADGLDMFGVQWAIFPSVQAGWVATNEKWFPKNIGIDYLRLNAGYDISGNDDINNYAAHTMFTMVKYNGTLAGLQLTTIGNDQIQWETTKKFNVGLETQLLHNRLGLSFDYYIHKTDNLLTLRSFSNPIGGLNRYWSNDGKLQNTGFEVAVSGKPIVAKDWNVEIGATVGHYKNEVKHLEGGDYTSSIYGVDNVITSVGNAVAMFYGYETNGVFATDKEAAAAGKEGYLYMEDNTGARKYFKAGDVHFIDRNGDGKISDDDRTIIGNPNPDIYGNIFANINWKNFTLSANFNYSLGNDVYNYQRKMLTSGDNFWNQQVSATKRWRYEGQVTDMPRAAFGDPMGNNRMSDRWIEDGSYLRLKTLTLSYRVPVNFSWLQGLTVWAEAVNLFTLTKYTGSDPEFSANSNPLYQGVDAGQLAQGRAFTFGLKINL